MRTGQSPRLRLPPPRTNFHVMRRLFASLLFASTFAFAAAADVEFVRVWPQWQNADAFERIGEYFGRGENDGRETVLRTHPDARAGLYFLVRVKSAALIEGSKFVVDVIRSDSPDPKSYSFPTTVPGTSHVYQLGLTEADWVGGRESHPVAWRLTLVDANGHVLASRQSFLWALPEPASPQ
jgi:hypothetical protein